MPRENLVELIKEGYDAWNRGDRSWVLEHMTPDVEWITPPDDPDHGTFMGHEGVGRFWDEWRDAVGLLRFEPVEFIGESSDLVVVARRSGRGNTSGAQIEDTVFQVFSFGPDDRCFRVREFYDRDQALTAAAGS